MLNIERIKERLTKIDEFINASNLASTSKCRWFVSKKMERRETIHVHLVYKLIVVIHYLKRQIYKLTNYKSIFQN